MPMRYRSHHRIHIAFRFAAREISLDEKGMQVVSMRNKANRLEELFLRLVEKGHQA